MCVCIHVVNRSLYLILKRVQPEIAVYNRKSNTEPKHAHHTKNHIVIKEQERVLRA